MNKAGFLSLNTFPKRSQTIEDKESDTILRVSRDKLPSTNSNANNQDKTPEQLKKDKFNRSLKQYAEMLVFMKNTYPNCFLYPPKPLAKKMEARLWEKELAKPEDKRRTKAQIHCFLERYTNSIKYKECLLEGVYRVDLDGQDITPITKTEADSAASEVKEIIAAHQYSAH